MKQIAWLLGVFLCFVTLAQAQGSEETVELDGVICRSACVSQVNNVNTCDASCLKDKSSKAVFVDDQGNVTPIAESSQKMSESYVGGHVTMKAAPTEEQGEKTLRIYSLTQTNPETPKTRSPI
jgi:hypothetical protein